MGATVSNFAKEAAKDALKWVAKKGISWVGSKIPIIGTPIADAINSRFAKGGKIHKFEDGGLVNKLKEEGIKTQVINTPAQLVAAIKKFPEAASKAGLTVEMVNDAKNEKVGNAPSKLASNEPMSESAMRKGGRRHKGHVEEVEEKEKPKKKHHKRVHMEEMYAQGGMVNPVASLPYDNLNRLNMYAHGGMHHHDNGLGESYVTLHHGRRHHV